MTRLNFLGQNIKKYREAKGLSQNQLAECVELSREHIGSVETGKDFLSLRKLFEIADILETPVKNFMNFD
jgi:transcriptional regulator with XRE-family HTH domain